MVCDKLIEFFYKKFAPCGVIWLFCSLIVDSAFTIFIVMDGEISDINCFLPKDSLEAYKNQVDRACLSRYKKFHEPVLPLRWLSTISTVWYAIITIFYVVVVHHRVEIIASKFNKRQEEGTGFVVTNTCNRPKEIFVYFSYFCHHLLCSVFGIILTGLQYPIFHHNGFSKDFACTLSPELQFSIMNGQNSSYMNLTSAPIHCESASAGPYKILSICLSVVNIFLAILLLVDLIHVLLKLKPYFKENIGLDFILVAKLFLDKNLRGGTNGEDGSSGNNPAGASGTNGEDKSSQNNCTEDRSSQSNLTSAIGTSDKGGSSGNNRTSAIGTSGKAGSSGNNCTGAIGTSGKGGSSGNNCTGAIGTSGKGGSSGNNHTGAIGTSGENGSSGNKHTGAIGTTGKDKSFGNKNTGAIGTSGEDGSSGNKHTGAAGSTSGEDGSSKNKHAYPVEISSENESFCTPPGSPTIPFPV